MTKIKICGLSRFEDIAAVNAARPDYIGFVFAASRRQVDMETARALKQSLYPGIKAVGVFVNHPVTEIIALAEAGIIELIQLHGDEDEAMVRLLQTQTGLPVIRALRISSPADIRETAADYRLFDTYDPSQYGGSGAAFNWDLLAGVTGDFFLAGGLNIDNIAAAINQVRPYCVDLSSGVETDGVKDRNKILHIVDIIRSITY
ncbi:phosphoribosylanthranilate isomerase [Acetobacterium sp.]|uniref:phosphoribosylanthranilate isomerase n=1 Tax=Acetobacterium sp. TaxID=1872094 RepID=UPI002715A970|nr:phosphoribosylanthranilate isomerase [Acetobacterium sp.]MDO9490976.1 phosphoribosylanthranilate isomerase [Acetobacterium sp.]